MQFKKMTNPTDGINESNKRLGSIYDQLCCVNSNLVNEGITFAPSTNFDSFGRLRVSEPLTLFDSSHRYADNGLWSTSSSTGGAAVFNSNQGSPTVNVLKDSLYTNQLERDGLTSTPYELCLEVAVNTTSGGEGILASADWEEVSR